MRPAMNEHSVNIFTQFFAIFAAIASAAGLTTQDLSYILFGAVGAFVSIAAFIFGRIDAWHTRKEDKRRTDLLADYIKNAEVHGANPAALEVINHAIERMHQK